MPDAPRLPSFERPPVVEVALSVMFQSLPQYSSGHAGRLWSEFPGYPITEDHTEVGLAIEEPPAPASPPVPQVLTRPPVRTWFISEDRARVVQVQHDRFSFNWRRVDGQNLYPGFESVLKEFEAALHIFVRYAHSANLGVVSPIQAELTYVNYLSELEQTAQSDLSEAFALWQRPPAGGFLPRMEDARFAVRYLIPDASGAMLGRLSANLQPAFVKTSRQAILALTMLARGRPLSADMDGVIGFLRLGHEWIVRGFAELTTPQAHKRWGRLR